MAEIGISANQNLLNMLKVWYRDGVDNLMMRNSPVLKMIEKIRVEGKEQRLAAIFGRGGSVAGNYLKSKIDAANNTKTAEFITTPGQLWSVYTVNAKEVQAGMSNRGAYMRIAGMKMFSSTEAFRKTMALAFYGNGDGTIAKYKIDNRVDISNSVATAITLPEDAIIKIDVDSKLQFKTNPLDPDSDSKQVVVDAIDGTTIYVKAYPSATVSLTDTTNPYYVQLAGSVRTDGTKFLPVGLDAWLPITFARKRDASNPTPWDTALNTSFYGVVRAAAPDRLAGQFYAPNTSEKMSDTIINLIRKCRQAGSTPNCIIMNDIDFLELQKEFSPYQTGGKGSFTTNDIKSKGKNNPTLGITDFQFAFSKNWIEMVIDDPYCPKGKFYVINTDDIKFYAYTNTDKINDGVAGNEAGKPDPMSDNNNGHEEDAQKLLIDDFITVKDGAETEEGPSIEVDLQCFGTFVVERPANNGVGLFYHEGSTPGQADYSDIIGY